LLEAHGLPVKETVLEKVRKQRAALAAVIDLWWQGVRQDVHTQMAVTPLWAHGVAAYWWPLMDWTQLVSRTRGGRRTAKMVQALEAAHAALATHPLTAERAPEV
jgi:hypothetical protein